MVLCLVFSNAIVRTSLMLSHHSIVYTEARQEYSDHAKYLVIIKSRANALRLAAYNMGCGAGLS